MKNSTKDKAKKKKEITVSLKKMDRCKTGSVEHHKQKLTTYRLQPGRKLTPADMCRLWSAYLSAHSAVF